MTAKPEIIPNPQICVYLLFGDYSTTSKIDRMELKVLFSEDPAFILNRAGVFLSSKPVLHNLILTILHARVSEGF